MARGPGSAIWRLAGGLLLAASIAACGTVAPAPPLPTPTGEAHLPPLPESAISVRAKVAYSAMDAAANAAVAPRFVDVAGVNLGHGVTFRLTGDRSDIHFSEADGKVAVSTSADITGVLDSRCVILTHCTGSLEVAGRVWAQARPTLNPDWTVSLSATGRYSIDKADVQVSLFPRSVSIRGPLSKVLEGPFDDLIARVNQEGSKSLALRTAAMTAWSEMRKPIQVSASPPVWLVMHPVRVLTEQPKITSDGVEMGSALIARPEIVIGDKPPDAEVSPFPDLALVDHAPDRFSLYLPVRLAYDDATDLAQRNIVGRQLSAGQGVTVTVKDVGIFNNGAEVGVKIAFEAKTKNGLWRPKGELYLLGTPVYNLKDGYIAVENLHYDVKTQDTILKVAAFLAHQALIDQLQSRLHFDMRAQVQARRHDLEAAIASTQLSPQVTLQGKIDTLAPSAVYLTRDFMQVNVVALGSLVVSAR